MASAPRTACADVPHTGRVDILCTSRAGYVRHGRPLYRTNRPDFVYLTSLIASAMAVARLVSGCSASLTMPW